MLPRRKMDDEDFLVILGRVGQNHPEVIIDSPLKEKSVARIHSFPVGGKQLIDRFSGGSGSE